MSNLYRERDKNVRRTWMLMVIFFVVVVVILSFFGYFYDAPELVVIAVLFAMGMNVGAYWFSDRIVLGISGAHEIDTNTSEGRQIYRLVENLAISAGLPMPKVYIIQDTAMNAFATGRDPEHGVIALTTGLIGRLEVSEIEGVIAHELAHIGNRDTLIQTVSVVLVGLVALLADMFLRMTIWGGGGRDDRDSKSGGFLLVIALALAILAPIFTQLLHLAISRKREYLADATGALMTRYPDGLASALQKISQDDHSLKKANRATAHLYISNPLSRPGKELAQMFSTHPPIDSRIEALTGMKVPEPSET